MDGLDYNFAHALGVFAAASKSGEVHETRDAVLTHNRSPVAAFNLCFLKNPSYKLERALERMAEYQARVGVPLRVHVSEIEEAGGLLTERGAVLVDRVPVMTLALDRVPGTAANDLEVTQVRTPSDLGEFGQLAFEAFGYPVAVSSVAFTTDFLALPHVQLYLGRLDARAVCSAMLLCTGPLAGIYWVAVGKPHRRKGYGAAIVAHALRAAREMGLEIAVLQASLMGESVYRGLGFTTVRHYLRYDVPPPLRRSGT